jgi:probable HAF family extracellular repeat protein
MTTLPTLGGDWCDAYAINSLGEVVGQSFSATHPYQGFIYSGGTMTNLGNLGADIETYAFGINDNHQVVGYSWNKKQTFLAFLYQKGKMRSLGTLGGEYSQAQAINNAGQVTGYAALKGDSAVHAFLYSKAHKMVDIDTLGGANSFGLAINSQGGVVGYRNLPAGYSAFIYQNGTMQDLNNLIPPNSGWTLGMAKGINDAGQISGWGTLNGQERGFLLTPTNP